MPKRYKTLLLSQISLTKHRKSHGRTCFFEKELLFSTYSHVKKSFQCIEPFLGIAHAECVDGTELFGILFGA